MWIRLWRLCAAGASLLLLISGSIFVLGLVLVPQPPIYDRATQQADAAGYAVTMFWPLTLAGTRILASSAVWGRVYVKPLSRFVLVYGCAVMAVPSVGMRRLCFRCAV